MNKHSRRDRPCRRAFGRIAVLKGGSSLERDVSLRSGAAVAGALGAAGYEVIEIDVTGSEVVLTGNPDAVFIALHGEFGEDGGVQRALERVGKPYTGSGPEASAAAFDKLVTKRILKESGISTPAHHVMRRGDTPEQDLPVVVKPIRQGSSIGVHIVRRSEDWEAAVADTLKYGDEFLAEQYIDGREITVGIVGDEPLPPVEIVVPDGWYDYTAKYSSPGTQYVVPASLEAEQAEQCRESAMRTFRALGCRGFGRVDMRVDRNGTVHVLELNSIPGFTETSLLPKAARYSGIEFPELCARIVELACTDEAASVWVCGACRVWGIE